MGKTETESERISLGGLHFNNEAGEGGGSGNKIRGNKTSSKITNDDARAANLEAPKQKRRATKHQKEI